MTSIQYPHIPFSYTKCSALCKKGDVGMREMVFQGNRCFIPNIPIISLSPFLTPSVRPCVRREIRG